MSIIPQFLKGEKKSLKDVWELKRWGGASCRGRTKNKRQNKAQKWNFQVTEKNSDWVSHALWPRTVRKMWGQQGQPGKPNRLKGARQACGPIWVCRKQRAWREAGVDTGLSVKWLFIKSRWEMDVPRTGLMALGLERSEQTWEILETPNWLDMSAALNTSANLENSAVATGLEKVSFHFNPKEGQCQRMFKLQYNCAHFTCYQGYAQNSSR